MHFLIATCMDSRHNQTYRPEEVYMLRVATIATGVLAIAALAFGQSDQRSWRSAADRELYINRRSISADAIRLYDAIAPLTTREQRQILDTVTPQLESELWTYNMYVYLDNHPDLTRKQLHAIRRNLAHVADLHGFERQTDPVDIERHRAAIQEIATVIDQAGFTPELATTAFIHLGPVAIRDAVQATSLWALPSQARPATYPPCMCISNIGCWQYFASYCDWDFICSPTYRCGYDGQQECIGVCTGPQ
jgi:hypothetical protein